MHCEDWWDITDPLKFTLIKTKWFFKDDDMRKQIDIAQKLEIISISLIQFIGNTPDKTINVPLKNLMFYIH